MSEDWLMVEIQKVLEKTVGKNIAVYHGYRPDENQPETLRTACITWWIEKSDLLGSPNCMNHVLVVRSWSRQRDAYDGISARSESRKIAFKIKSALHAIVIHKANPTRLAVFSAEETARINQEDNDAESRGWDVGFVIQTEE